MAVEDRDQRAVRRQVAEQALDMAPCMDEAALAGAARGGPAGVQAIGRGHGEEADVAAILGHQADRLDRLARDRALIGDDDLAVRAGLPEPVGAVDDRLTVGGSSLRIGCSSGRVDRRR